MVFIDRKQVCSLILVQMREGSSENEEESVAGTQAMTGNGSSPLARAVLEMVACKWLYYLNWIGLMRDAGRQVRPQTTQQADGRQNNEWKYLDDCSSGMHIRSTKKNSKVKINFPFIRGPEHCSGNNICHL